jgi:glycosyltransferase 2 family protein
MDLLLPASWRRIDSLSPRYHEVRMPFSGCAWIPFADVPASYDIFDLYSDLNASFPAGYVIRGCHPEISDWFLSRQHDTIRTGIEAVLELSDGSHFDGKKVKAALKRGWRQGFVEEVPIDALSSTRFTTLFSTSPHAGKPQLRHVFRSDPFHASRCFVFSSFSGNWLACVTLSRQGAKAFHTELMLRSRNAPGDIMECLITEISARLRDEGVAELSLGEVPFLRHETDHQPLSLLEQMLFAAAPLFSHVYDYEKLYFFKNKFRPIWRTMRLCAGPRVQFSPSFLAMMAHAMGLVELLIFGRAVVPAR